MGAHALSVLRRSQFRYALRNPLRRILRNELRNALRSEMLLVSGRRDTEEPTMLIHRVARHIATQASRRANRVRIGSHQTVTRLRAVIANLVARVNGNRVTAAAFLASIGADNDTIRRYAAQVGIRASKLARSLGAEPSRDGLAVVAHRRLVVCNTYPVEILAETVRDYPKVAALLNGGF
jgi:hypothetical protein